MKLQLLIISLLALTITGCATKIPIKSWAPPQLKNVIADVDQIIIANSKTDNHLFVNFETALRQKLSEYGTIGINSSISTEKMIYDLKEYNFNPVIKTSERVGTLSFDIIESYEIRREKQTRKVTLQSCNYMLEKNQCRKSGSGITNEGLQTLNYGLKATITLKDNKGTDILPPQTISKGYSASTKVVPDKLLLRRKVSDLIATLYARMIIPYKEHIDITLLNGDGIAMEMIEKGAYSPALIRLEKVITDKENDNKIPENYYLQGVIAEVQGDFVMAIQKYNEALILDKENEIIIDALKRIEKVFKVKKA